MELTNTFELNVDEAYQYKYLYYPVDKLILVEVDDWKPFTLVRFGNRKFVNFDPPTIFKGLVFPFE